MTKKVCKLCKSFVEGTACPLCGGTQFSETWKGKVAIIKPNESEIANFGAFINMGCIDGMIHISQTMDDFVSFSKSNTLVGKNSKRVLKKGDQCLARIVAVSYKTEQPKIGLTMRQPGLGKLEWIADDKRKSKLQAVKVAKAAEKPGKKK